MIGAELLQTGRLSDAIARVAGEVKTRPSDPAARIFYFELLSLAGDLDRAAKQLDVLASTTGEIGVGIYEGALQAEKERQKFFHSGPRPRVLSDPPFATAYLEAIEHYAAGDSATAMSRLEAANEEEHSLHGTLNGKELNELTDSNDLLGPFLEVAMDGHYAWVPWQSIESLTIPAPRYLRDTIWTPASLSLHSGDHGEVLLFSLYVDSCLQEADEIKLGRRTVWEQNPAGFTVAYGQKVLASGQQDWPILEVRSLEVDACRLAA
jgi:type VI secretion system protein ImpE